jgi:hypothetical protein
MTKTRMLAAIMFTDIVGYTSLMGRDEHLAFDLLKKNREIHLFVHHVKSSIATTFVGFN